MPSATDTSVSSCYGKSKNREKSNVYDEKNIFKTKVDILNCKPEDVKLKVEGNRVIIEGKLFKNSKEKPVYFSKHHLLPENCDLNKMRYTITPDGVFISAPRKEDSCSDWPKLEEDCTTNCKNLKDRFEIRLNVQEFKPEDIKIKVNGNTIIIKARRLQETGMSRSIIKTYSLPENCEITKLERKFTPQGHLILSIPKFLGLFCDPNKNKNEEKLKDNVKCKFNITSDKFEIKIDVSNFRPQDINIIQQKRMVTVEGKTNKKFGHYEDKFEKTFALPPDYDVTKIDRKFHSDGILVISVPRIGGKPTENFKMCLPENSICDMMIKEDYVQIKLDVAGYAAENIIIKVAGKNTVTVEGKQPGEKGKINKSFMKSYLLPTDCDTKSIKKHISSNGTLIVKIPRNKRSTSLENLMDISNLKVNPNRTRNSSLDNLSASDDEAMVDSAELDQEKFEMKFNVQGFQTEDIYVKINKNIVTVECKHAHYGKDIIKSYLVPDIYDLDALHTYITHDDILIVTIPRRQEKRKEQINLLNTGINESNGCKHDEDNYVIKVDIRGYNNNDISIDIKGQTVIIQGGHLGNKTVSKSFSKKFNIPQNFNVEALTYYICAGGFLTVEIPKRKTNTQSERNSQLYTFPNDAKDTENPFKNKQEYNQNKNREVSKLYNNENSENIRLKKHQSQSQNGKILKLDINKANDSKLSNNGKNVDYEPENYSSLPDVTKHRCNVSNFSVLTDDKGNDIFRINVDISECKEKEIDVRIKDRNLRVMGKKQEDSDSSEDFLREFIVPKEFNMRGIKTKLEKSMLLIDIPKNEESKMKESTSNQCKDILSNVKIGREEILVELDASDLKIEDFEISTHKSILTIEILKEILGDVGKFKTKVDLPDDCLIDEISKIITSEGKLLVKIPRKVKKEVVYIENQNDDVFPDITSLRTDSKIDKRKSCMAVPQTNLREKSKSVKFLVDDFENEETTKFATLPRSTRSKSYNNLIVENSVKPTVNGRFELAFFVPNHEPDEVIVKVRGNTVTIEGKKSNDKGNTYFSKNFFRTYIVPDDIDSSQLKTTFVDKYLIIRAPKKNEKVEIDKKVEEDEKVNLV